MYLSLFHHDSGLWIVCVGVSWGVVYRFWEGVDNRLGGRRRLSLWMHLVRLDVEVGLRLLL